MLAAVAAMYQVTESVLGIAVLAATIGVRQGSPTSCLLFILYVNDLIKRVKENCADDGFLSWLHIVVMVDDTVLLATARQRMQQKLLIGKQFFNEHGMKINQTKTKGFVINSTPADKGTDSRGGCRVVEYCERWVHPSPRMAQFSRQSGFMLNVKCHML